MLRPAQWFRPPSDSARSNYTPRAGRPRKASGAGCGFLAPLAGGVPLPARSSSVSLSFVWRCVVSAFSSLPFVVFSGSRRLSAAFWPLVRDVVAAVLGAGRAVSVGCSVGADAAVIRAVVALGAVARCRVFAVFGRGGEGGWSGSAVDLVQSASQLGVPVSWVAGGSVFAPGRFGPGCLVQRLRVRSARSVWHAARSGAGSGFVGFVSARRSPGTWGTARFAARLGLPVVVFPVGDASVADFPLFARGGCWVPAARSGVWSSGFRWVAG